MWRPDQIPALRDELKSAGITVAPELLSNLNQGPAAAVVSMGGGTASFVSKDGLLLTNHHVAYDAIQMNSDAEHDYLTFGFQAPSRDRELPAPTYHALLLKNTEDVTPLMRQAIVGIPEQDARGRFQAIDKRQKELVATCETQSGLKCEVTSFDHGLQYQLMRYLELRDIRLVYAPPVGVGDYGGETDNFMWPRHAGDFSFMRAYVGPDGKPADYSTSNQPYHPDVVLRPSATPAREGAALQIFGYPYVTNRKLTAAGMAEEEQLHLPEYERFTGARLDRITAASRHNRDRAIRLAAEAANLGNGLKLTHGKLIAMRRSQVVALRAKEEAAMQAWMEADPARLKQYGALLPALNALTAESTKDFPRRKALKHLYLSAVLVEVADLLLESAEQHKKPDMERLPAYQDRHRIELRQYLQQLQRDLDIPLQEDSLATSVMEALALPPSSQLAGLASYFKPVPLPLKLEDGETYPFGLKPQQTLQSPAQIAQLRQKRQTQVSQQVKQWLRTTRLDELSVRLDLFDHPEKVANFQDPLLTFARRLRPEHVQLQQQDERRNGTWDYLFPLWQEARQAFDPHPHYPDANSTIRYTYGRIKPYSPADAVTLASFTTVAGVAEKHTGHEPFNAPARLLEEAPSALNLPVDFLATVDTTGGNSGSPVLNGSGELIGLLFDGNYESTGDEFVFWEEKQRSICVDIRYIQWMISQVDRANGLATELNWPVLPRQ